MLPPSFLPFGLPKSLWIFCFLIFCQKYFPLPSLFTFPYKPSFHFRLSPFNSKPFTQNWRNPAGCPSNAFSIKWMNVDVLAKVIFGIYPPLLCLLFLEFSFFLEIVLKMNSPSHCLWCCSFSLGSFSFPPFVPLFFYYFSLHLQFNL